MSTSYYNDGSVHQQIDGAGKATTYTEDPLGRVATMADPLGRASSFTYNGTGAVLAITDAANQTTTNAYDNAGQLLSTNYSDGVTPNVTHAYNGAGAPVSMTDGSGTQTWTYDSLGRMTAHANGASATVTYGYDIRGELKTIGYPGKGNVTRTYGDDGEMTGVTDYGSRNFIFAYDQDMNPTTTGYPNGVSSANAYDNAGRLTSITDSKGPATLASFTYGRSVGGDVTGETSGGTSAGSNKTYTYNTLGQLASENGGNFTYDSADNLTKKADGTLMTYDVANQVQTKTPSSGPATTYAYDTKGNRTGSVTNNVTTNASYDQANRMTAYGPSATYNYDGGGLRTSKTVSGAVTNFTYDTADGLPLIIDDGANAYVYGPGGTVLEQINGSTPTYLHHDQLGSTRLLTDSSGAAVGTYQFDAYGNATSHTGTATSPMQYAGQYLDSESGLYWMRARMYDPGTGQFVSRDPLAALTRSPYAYVDQNPTNGRDPSGACGTLGAGEYGPIVPCRQLAEEATNPQLKNLVGQLYKGNATIGDGGTADALLSEVQSGERNGKGNLPHFQKVCDRLKQLDNIQGQPGLSVRDHQITDELRSRLEYARGQAEQANALSQAVDSSQAGESLFDEGAASLESGASTAESFAGDVETGAAEVENEAEPIVGFFESL